MPPRRPGGPGHGPRGHGYQQPQDLRGTVRKLLRYVGRYKGLLVLVAVCLLLSSVGSVASSYFLKPAINDYILPGDFAGLLKLLVLMGLVFVLSALCSYVLLPHHGAGVPAHGGRPAAGSVRQAAGASPCATSTPTSPATS